jgi:hypothetical protein
VTFTKIGCAFRAVWAALMRAPLASAMNNTKLGCAARDPVAALLCAPLSAAVNTAKLGCADRALGASLLMRAPLSASVTFTKICCALRAVGAALMRASLSAAVTSTHTGCALREVWLTSRMRAHARIPFTSGSTPRVDQRERITIRLHVGFKCKETGLGAKKNRALCILYKNKKNKKSNDVSASV